MNIENFAKSELGSLYVRQQMGMVLKNYGNST